MDPETARALLLRRGIRLASNDDLLTLVLLNDVVLKGVLNPMFTADTKDMQAILRDKGIRISDGDPIFALLALNGIVLNHSIDKVRRAQIMIGSASGSAIYLKTLTATALVLGFGVGVFFGTSQFETSRVLAAVFGGFLGIALGVLGMAFIGKYNEK